MGFSLTSLDLEANASVVAKVPTVYLLVYESLSIRRGYRGANPCFLAFALRPGAYDCRKSTGIADWWVHH